MFSKLLSIVGNLRVYSSLALTAGGILFGGYLLFSLAVLSPEISFGESTELGDEVVIKFDPLTTERRARERFSIEPSIAGELVWLSEHNELHFIPEEGFNPDVKYTVRAGRFSHFSASVISPKTFTFQSKKQEAQAVKFAAPDAPRYIDINISTMILSLVENGTPVQSFPIGAKGNPWTKPTKEGTFKINIKEKTHFSSIWRLWMPWSMQYSGNYFIHGWPYWPGGRLVQGKYSGGCVRLATEDAEKVFNWVEVGTPVVVHSTPGRIPLFQSDNIKDGDIVREESSGKVYIVKISGDELYKRHVWTEDFSKWYVYIAPFWQRVKVVSDGSLARHFESRWVTSNANDGVVYELDIARRMKYPLSCNTSEKAETSCVSAWSAYGWPSAEIYSASPEELEVLKTGESIPLRPAPVATKNNE